LALVDCKSLRVIAEKALLFIPVVRVSTWRVEAPWGASGWARSWLRSARLKRHRDL